MLEDAKNWDLLQSLFELAEATPKLNRERVLREHCSDEYVVQRALSIAQSADDVAHEHSHVTTRFLAGRIGPYTLIRAIGSGGIGTVYLAERIFGGAPQRVALKVLAPHAAGPSFVERFHREQHILASLDHPNITRLIDAGLRDDEQPYLVMDYVEGEHLTAYCDEHRLTIPHRIGLFLQVCEAVAYAHSNLIVHLDLKPSNILVTDESVVKLLDFGTSKLVQTDSLLTTTVLATPAFASPEQLRNEPVTTACDIYSLGVILSELLAGSRAGGSTSMAIMMERAIREQEADPLGGTVTEEAAERRGVSIARLRVLIRGDLENIVAKCLRARPKDRYSSVDLLMQDIRNYMEGRPVTARPQTAAYRVGKFVRRNFKAVAATAAALLILAAALSYAGWKQHQAVEEGQRALRMQTFLYRLLRLANKNYMGKNTLTIPEFLSFGASVLPDYLHDPEDLRKAQLGLADSLYENEDFLDAQRVFGEVIASARAAGDVSSQVEAEAVSGHISYRQGDYDRARALSQEALDLSHRRGVSSTAQVFAMVYYAADRDKSGYRSDDNLRLLERAARQARADHLPPHEVGDALYFLAVNYDLRGRMDDAEKTYREALAIYGDEPAALCDQCRIYLGLAVIMNQRGDPQGSLTLFQKAADGYSRCTAPTSNSAALVETYRSNALIRLGRAQEALSIMESVVALWEAPRRDSPDFFHPLVTLAMAQLNTGHPEEAQHNAEKTLGLITGKIAPTDARFGLCHLIIARALMAQRRNGEALPHAQIADQILGQSVPLGYPKDLQTDAHRLLADLQEHVAPRETSPK